MRYEYLTSITLSKEPFYALLMAAMRTADSPNLARLQDAFPEVYYELRERYNAPGGYLPGEV